MWITVWCTQFKLIYYKVLAQLMAAALVGAAQIWQWCSTTCSRNCYWIAEL